MLKRMTHWFCLLSLLVCTPHALAWGGKGHRLTGHVAYSLLTPTARANLAKIMGSADLAAMTLYLDTQRERLDKDIPGSREWHYDNKPACKDNVPVSAYCPQGNCASVQIGMAYKRLVDMHETKSAKQFAIFVLAHVIGDLHQPLHVADDNDAGGNQLRIHATWADGSEAQVNLHALWDTTIVEKMYRWQDERVVAARLVQEYADEGKAWVKKPMAVRIEETHAIAREVVYAKVPGFACGSTDEKETLNVGDAYLREAAQIIERQIARAGYSIAHMLNRALRD